MNNELDACYICPVCKGASGLAVYNSTCSDCLYPERSPQAAALIAGTKALIVGNRNFVDGKLLYDSTSALSRDDGALHPHELPADFTEAQI